MKKLSIIVLALALLAAPAAANKTTDTLTLANNKMKAGDFQGAMMDYDRIINEGARGMFSGLMTLSAYAGRGMARMALGDLDGAEADATYCITNATNMVPADYGYALRGRVRAQKGDREGAFADYEAGVDAAQKGAFDKGRTAIAYSERGIGKALFGDIDGAVADLTLAAEAPIGVMMAKYYSAHKSAWQSAKTGFEKLKMGDQAGASMYLEQAAAGLNSSQFGGYGGVSIALAKKSLFPVPTQPQYAQQQAPANPPQAQYAPPVQQQAVPAAPAPVALTPKEEISKYASALAASVPKSAEPNPNIYAVILGVGKYKDLPSVKYAAYDAQRMRIYLKNVVGVPERNIDVFTDEDATIMTFKRLFERDLARKVVGAEAVYFYYAGHGTPGADGTYLAPYDAEIDYAESLYPVSKVVTSLQALDTKKVVMLMDTCFSGKGDRSRPASGRLLRVVSEEDGVFPRIDAQKTTYMSATTSQMRSFDYDEKKSGLFTYFLTEGLGGAADVNKDGSITATELHAYVEDKILETVRMNPEKYGDDQRPTIWPETPEAGKTVVAKVPK